MSDKMMETALLKLPVHSAGICRLVWGLDITFNYCPWVLKSHVSEEIQPQGSPGSCCCRWGCRSYQGQSSGSQRTKLMEIGLWRIPGHHRLLRLLKMYSRVNTPTKRWRKPCSHIRWAGIHWPFPRQKGYRLRKKNNCKLRKDLAWER